MLCELAGENIRNLEPFTLTPGNGLNLVVGNNAAGKTSLLEAVHLLSVGRSFRTSRIDEVVCRGCDSGLVRGLVQEPRSGRRTRLVFSRTVGQTVCRIDGESIESASQLARYLPVQALHPESHRLLTGGPAYRRAFIDWGCFYQEPGFFSAWRRFRRALFQRNAALKQHAGERVLDGIEREFCLAAGLIDVARAEYVAALRDGFRDIQELWPGGGELELDYRRGWGEDRQLEETLAAERPQARRIGHSLAGPQRADLIVKSEGERVAVVFSRGQIKQATAALTLAQTGVFEATTGRDVLLLVDDLPSELDSEGQELLLHRLTQRNRQCFITALSAGDLTNRELPEHRMFHVEHGRVSELL